MWHGEKRDLHHGVELTTPNEKDLEGQFRQSVSTCNQADRLNCCQSLLLQMLLFFRLKTSIWPASDIMMQF